jgi:GT2 family glycosyltransferase
MPTSPAGTVPRAWLTVLRLALARSPALALSGLVTLLRGKRLRAWNRLCLAAAEHPKHYANWIRVVEPGLLPPRAKIAEPGLVGAIILGGDSAATRTSLAASFGPDLAIFDSSSALPASNRPTWLLPIRAGDEVSQALGAVLAAQLRDCPARLAYWDEDHQVQGRRSKPWIKPDWDPLLFAAHDGFVGSCVLRADVIGDKAVADWSALSLTIAESGSAPLHLPLILTHRSEPRVKAAQPAAVPAPPVAISVIIPTRDRAELLESCLSGLLSTRFPGKREIIVVDNDSREPRTKVLFERLEAAEGVRVIAQPGPFNFAALINAGVASARGDLVCLLNNDVEITSPDWLLPMAVLAVCEDIGAVGARLLYPDGVIQHAGVALGIGDAAGHVDKGVKPVPGEFAPWHGETRTVSAVTAACLLVGRAKFVEVGGMDEQTFAVDFNDVDLCLKLAARSWRTVYCAQAALVHHESRSRGKTHHGADLARFEQELSALRARWDTDTIVDPYHSPLFRRQSERCLLAF